MGGRTLALLFKSLYLVAVFCSFYLVSIDLICLCHCLPVYSMGCFVGSLEHLHHLFLPGCRRPVQGETFISKFSPVLFFQIFLHASISKVRSLCLYCDERSFLSKVMVAGWWGSEA